MPLININNGRVITKHPHAQDLARIRKHAGEERYQAMMDDLDQRVHGKEVTTSSWMPPRENWRNTVYAPLAELAGDDRKLSGMLFGSLVWAHFMDRPERWGFVRAGSEDEGPSGITYFLLT